MRMTGIDDRGDFYRFWYHTVDLTSGEEPLESWKAMRVPTSMAEQFYGVAGNLIVTTQRLIFEPYRNHRVAFGRHGSKMMINGLASLSDRIGRPAPITVSLDDLSVQVQDDSKFSMQVSARDAVKVAFFFGRTTVGRGDAARRDAVLARILMQKSRSSLM
jgi:hypothetical protein